MHQLQQPQLNCNFHKQLVTVVFVQQFARLEFTFGCIVELAPELRCQMLSNRKPNLLTRPTKRQDLLARIIKVIGTFIEEVAMVVDNPFLGCPTNSKVGSNNRAAVNYSCSFCV